MKQKQSRREFVRVLFLASQAVAASRLLPATLFAGDVPPANPTGTPPDGLNFLLFGDWGRRGQADQVRVAAQMAKESTAVGARFLVAVGDNFYEGGVTSTEDDHWRVSFENVYHQPSLQIPWHVILGNHDYVGNCDAQIAYSKLSPRWHMPARYYVQTHRIDPATTADFFYLDTTPMVKSYYKATVGDMRANVLAEDVPAQLAWFRRALEASKAQWKIVIGHHPIYSGNALHGTPELVELVLPILHEFKVQAYFHGHDHDLQHLVADKLHFFCSGAGSIPGAKPLEMEYTTFTRNVPGFVAVNLQADKLNVRMIDGNGQTLHNATVPRVQRESAALVGHMA